MTSNYVFIDFKFCWPWLQIMLALPSHFFVLTSNFVLHGLQNMLALTKNYISIAKYIALTTNNVYIDLNFFFHWQLKFGIEFNFRLCLHRLEIMFRLNSKKCLLRSENHITLLSFLAWFNLFLLKYAAIVLNSFFSLS